MMYTTTQCGTRARMSLHLVISMFLVYPACHARDFETASSPIILNKGVTIASELQGYQEYRPADDNLNAFQELTFTADLKYILIGEREKVHIVPVANITNILDTEVFSNKSNPTVGALPCETIAENSERQCRNYITVIQPLGNDNVLVCGTNGFVPLCYSCTYNMTVPDLTCGNDSSSFFFTDESGLAAFEPLKETALSYLSDVDPFGDVLFAGGSEELNQDSVISRVQVDSEGKINLDTELKTDKDDPDWLNDAAFIGDPIDYGDHMYFFFRETATEYINAGKIVYSRVGRVCKNDEGGSLSTVLDGKWTTFQKARLNCSTQGDIPFYYNELRDIYQTGASGGEIIYTTFSTPGTTITTTGSAVCIFRMDEIQQLFNEGKFKGQERVGKLWLPVDENKVTMPRPGSCGQPQPTASFQFIKKYPLMDELIPSTREYRTMQDYTHTSNSPLAVIKNTKIVQIVVDEMVTSASGTRLDVIFVASGDGFIYKLYKANGSDTVIVDEYDLELDTGTNEVLVTMELQDKTLYIGTSERVLTVPVEHCTMSYKQCYRCVQAQDPYCSWKNGACQSEVTDGIQCLTPTRKPYECASNCDDWPKPKLAFATDDAIYVAERPTPILFHFTATTPLNSDLELNFICNCADGATSCTDQFTPIESRGSMTSSNVEWVSLILTADSWNVTCSPAEVILSATAYGITTEVTRLVKVDKSDIIGATVDFTEDQIIDYDEELAAFEYEISMWENMVLDECPDIDLDAVDCKANPYE